MIPDKRKPGYQPGHEQSEAQKLSSKENFALFTLMGMRGQLAHLRGIEGIGVLSIHLRANIDKCIYNIKEIQAERKAQKKSKRKS